MIKCYHILIIFHYGNLWVRVIINGAASDNMTECGVLNLSSKLSDSFLFLLIFAFQVDLHAWCLNIFGNINNLLESGNTKCHILG